MEEGRIQRDKKRAGGAIAGILFFVGSFALVFSRADGGLLIIGGLVGLVACGYAAFALYYSGVGFCPTCNMRLSGLAMDDNEGVRCRGCDGYVDSKDGALSMAGEDSLASVPRFQAACPDRVVWPEGCCVCGEPATRQLLFKLEERESAPLAGDMAVRVASLGTLKLDEVRTNSVHVPHCDDHDHGAELIRSQDEEGAELALLFRWNDYRRRFEALNS